MPKVIDHEKRKIQLAEATWKIIAEEGIEQATVRKIASAAGLSVGALRHYFSSQSELLSYSMELVSERVRQRALAKTYQGNPLDIIKESISELLPADDERRIEMEVWLVFSVKMLVDAKLRPLSENVYQEMHDGLGQVLQLLSKLGMLKDELDMEAEINRLHSLVDGLALHHLLHPSVFSYEKMMKTLDYHLRSICLPESKNKEQ
ncbi:TetR/AcrR family transcriptional regulator [Peribacillus frigoritolerans]|uniref:TetR/AcrR family transcriptional regulator n=1 Tax=Peribacillus frigoritolerans TaxID=450367 RepID=UPI00105A930E|nr:TetR/AcrR family transcriptional regulator [Peribacillus frigoritolerans]TDL80461.1 TetR family transcriptional regulator [Peribacillus frigoritolerans]